jgi:hypothetical protein
MRTHNTNSDNKKVGFFFATVLPYIVSFGAILKGRSVQDGDKSKTYWYALGFLSYLIATIAGQIIAASSLKRIIDAGTATDLDRSNYQYASYSAFGTGVLIAMVLAYVLKVYQQKQ